MIFIDIKQVQEMLDKLVEKILPNVSKFSWVVGIANGGLHISRPLAARLYLPHSSVRISHYERQIQRDVPIIEGYLPQATGNLIVDDLIDDGFTMRTFNKHFGLEGNETAVLFCKKNSFVPTYYVAEKPREWIIWPWDN
jgi:hypoxanthine phosphoribosyltransferase